jgi:Methyladenine glycosylase
MGNDVIIGYDGKPRCPWAGATETALGRYHDEVWGKRTYAEPAMFEALTLGVFQVGLSWSIVFGKRDAFCRAFYGFNIATRLSGGLAWSTSPVVPLKTAPAPAPISAPGQEQPEARCRKAHGNNEQHQTCEHGDRAECEHA